MVNDVNENVTLTKMIPIYFLIWQSNEVKLLLLIFDYVFLQTVPWTIILKYDF